MPIAGWRFDSLYSSWPPLWHCLVVTPERMKARGRAGAQAPQPLCPDPAVLRPLAIFLTASFLASFPSSKISP